MLRITLPANADLSIFDDVLRRDELVQMLRDCGIDADKETLVVKAEKPVDLLAIVAEHIRDQGVYPAGGIVEELPATMIPDQRVYKIHLKVANRGMILYRDQGPELNLMDPITDDTPLEALKEVGPKSDFDKGDRYYVNRVARPEDPDFFDQIDDWIKNTVLKGWGSVQA